METLNKEKLNNVFSFWAGRKDKWSGYEIQLEYYKNICKNVNEINESKIELNKDLKKYAFPVIYEFWKSCNMDSNGETNIFKELINIYYNDISGRYENDKNFLDKIKDDFMDIFNSDSNLKEEFNSVVNKNNYIDKHYRYIFKLLKTVSICELISNKNNYYVTILKEYTNPQKSESINVDWFLDKNKNYYKLLFSINDDSLEKVIDNIVNVFISTNAKKGTRGGPKKVINRKNNIIDIISLFKDFTKGDTFSKIMGNEKKLTGASNLLKEACGIYNLNTEIGFIYNSTALKALQDLYDRKKIDSSKIIEMYSNIKNEYKKEFNENYSISEEILKKHIDYVENTDYSNLILNVEIDQMFYVHYSRSDVANISEIFEKYNKQLIIYGAPGTGKTYSALEYLKNKANFDNEDRNKNYIEKLKFHNAIECKEISNKNDSKVIILYELKDEYKNAPFIWDIVQFNPTYSYEDFIEGYKPTLDPNSKSGFMLTDGIFKKICNAAKSINKPFYLIIDEINRGNIPKIFGELLYLLEYRDTNLNLHYSNEPFSIPNEIYIIGTMNTADKSLAAIDIALRRRFWFFKLNNDDDALFNKLFPEYKENTENDNFDFDAKNPRILAFCLYKWINEKIKDVLEKDEFEGLEIGHSYFMELVHNTQDSDEDETENISPNEISFSDLLNHWHYRIIPLLEEYLNYDIEKVKSLLKLRRNKLKKGQKDSDKLPRDLDLYIDKDSNSINPFYKIQNYSDELRDLWDKYMGIYHKKEKDD